MSKLTANHSDRAVPSDNSSVKLLVFKIGKLTLALPISQVQKVIKYQDVDGSGLSHANQIYFGRQPITVVDLHQQFGVSRHPTSLAKGYFTVGKTTTGKLLGIAVSSSPSIVDVPSDRIRAIPEAYRRANSLRVASHVAIIVQSETPLTILILDLEQLY